MRLFVIGLVLGSLYLQTRAELSELGPVGAFPLVAFSLLLVAVALSLATWGARDSAARFVQRLRVSIALRVVLSLAWLIAGLSLGTGYSF